VLWVFGVKLDLTQWAKSPKKQSVGVFKKRTPPDCFFGDFAHWVEYTTIDYDVLLTL